jgi:hypothetical protein
MNKQQLKKIIREEIKATIKESGILYRAGVKKYGKEGMTKIQSAAGKGADHAEIGAIKDKYEKDKKEGVVREAKVKHGSQLQDAEVDKLHKIERNLDNPNYPKKVIGKQGEAVWLLIKVKGKEYIIFSDPYGNDEWYHKDTNESMTNETKAEGYDDPAYRATVKQFKGKKASKKEFAQALAMHHQSMDESVVNEASDQGKVFVSDQGVKLASSTYKTIDEWLSKMGTSYIRNNKSSYDKIFQTANWFAATSKMMTNHLKRINKELKKEIGPR